MKGSARSTAPINIVDLMNQCATHLLEFGGHAEAGGCKLKSEHFDAWVKHLQSLANTRLKAHGPIPFKTADAQLDLDHITQSFMDQMCKIGPFGMGHGDPIFSSVAKVIGKSRQVGQGHLKAQIASPQGKLFPVIAFGKYGAWNEKFEGEIFLYHTPKWQVWMGKTDISLHLQGFEKIA